MHLAALTDRICSCLKFAPTQVEILLGLGVVDVVGNPQEHLLGDHLDPLRFEKERLGIVLELGILAGHLFLLELLAEGFLEPRRTYASTPIPIFCLQHPVTVMQTNRTSRSQQIRICTVVSNRRITGCKLIDGPGPPLKSFHVKTFRDSIPLPRRHDAVARRTTHIRRVLLSIQKPESGNVPCNSAKNVRREDCCHRSCDIYCHCPVNGYHHLPRYHHHHLHRCRYRYR